MVLIAMITLQGKGSLELHTWIGRSVWVPNLNCTAWEGGGGGGGGGGVRGGIVPGYWSGPKLINMVSAVSVTSSQ